MTEDEAVKAMAAIVTARADLAVLLGTAHDARIWETLGLEDWEDFMAAVLDAYIAALAAAPLSAPAGKAPAAKKTPARARRAHRNPEEAERDPRTAVPRVAGRQVTPRWKP